MAQDTDIVQGAIVLVGKFNPAIFSPAWFAKNGLISEGELGAAETQVVHPQITQWTVEHLKLTVETSKFVLQVTSEPLIRLLDLTLQTFQDYLSHTPIHAVGINYTEHWRLDSVQRRFALGRSLAPIEPWGEWGEEMNSPDDFELKGGMIDLKMFLRFPPERNGHMRVEIAPSAELTDKLRGVVVGTNYHREWDWVEGEGPDQGMRIIEDEFDEAIRSGKAIVNRIKDFAAGLSI